MSQTEQKIHSQMTIEQILGMFPNKAQKLSQEITNAGLHCVGCGAATWETLEQGMQSHGKTPDQVEYLVGRLNNLLNEPVDLSTVSLTEKGAKKFMQILKDDGREGWALRLDEQMAGCSGFEYILDYSEKAQADDVVFTSFGVEIHVNNKKLGRLLGSEIDYVEGLHSTGFKISNPNAKSSCGCGTSHGY